MYKITSECKACGACLESCPVDGAIIVGKPYQIDPELCAECGACVNECLDDAITEE